MNIFLAFMLILSSTISCSGNLVNSETKKREQKTIPKDDKSEVSSPKTPKRKFGEEGSSNLVNSETKKGEQKTIPKDDKSEVSSPKTPKRKFGEEACYGHSAFPSSPKRTSKTDDSNQENQERMNEVD